ncbi:MAG: hypothetical protein M0T84_00115 [Betaproteobacteria bacterium]|nr:hypothetical protein [Betaproteobacteria bacterium]
MDEPVTEQEMSVAFARSALETLGWTFEAAMENPALVIALRRSAQASRKTAATGKEGSGHQPVQLALI